MRGSDKRSGRRKVYPCVFDPYVADFFARFPAGRVYVATESIGYAEHAKKAWGERWGLDRVLVPSLSTRVSSKTANFRVHDRLTVAHEPRPRAPTAATGRLPPRHPPPLNGTRRVGRC
jgi:hypothetical protein